MSKDSDVTGSRRDKPKEIECMNCEGRGWNWEWAGAGDLRFKASCMRCCGTGRVRGKPAEGHKQGVGEGG